MASSAAIRAHDGNERPCGSGTTGRRRGLGRDRDTMSKTGRWSQADDTCAGHQACGRRVVTTVSHCGGSRATTSGGCVGPTVSRANNWSAGNGGEAAGLNSPGLRTIVCDKGAGFVQGQNMAAGCRVTHSGEQIHRIWTCLTQTTQGANANRAARAAPTNRSRYLLARVVRPGRILVRAGAGATAVGRHVARVETGDASAGGPVRILGSLCALANAARPGWCERAIELLREVLARITKSSLPSRAVRKYSPLPVSSTRRGNSCRQSPSISARW